MDKLLYKPTMFSELTSFVNYTIHVSEDHYYVGMCMGLITEPTLATFLNPRVVYKEKEGAAKRICIRAPPLYVSDKRTFKRIIYEKEQNAAYRAAFEKRAVNQIVSSIVGHAGDYY